MGKTCLVKCMGTKLCPATRLEFPASTTAIVGPNGSGNQCRRRDPLGFGGTVVLLAAS